MNTRQFIILTILALTMPLVIMRHAHADSMGADYLCEIGMEYFEKADYGNALHEFKKALIVDPNNQTALDYIYAIQRCTGDTTATRTRKTGYTTRRYAAAAASAKTVPEEGAYTPNVARVAHPSARTEIAYEPSYTSGNAVPAVSNYQEETVGPVAYEERPGSENE